MLQKASISLLIALGFSICIAAPSPALAQKAGAQQTAAAVADTTVLTDEAARGFIAKMGERTMTALRMQDTQQRGAALGRILLDGMDFDVVSMHTLGRFGRRADSKDFQEFATLFAAYIIDMAIEKFGSMPIDSYAITSTAPMPNGDVVVQTSVAAGTAPVTAGWRVRLMPSGPKIIDILVDGYSMTTHFAGQYQDWLSKAGLEGLVTKMRGQTRNSPSLLVVREIRGAS